MKNKKVFGLKFMRFVAEVTGNEDEVLRLDEIIERKETDAKVPPLHTKHHEKPNTTSINDEGHLVK